MTPSPFDDFMAMVSGIQEQYGDILTDPAALAAFQNALTIFVVGNQAAQAEWQKDSIDLQRQEAEDQRLFRQTVEMPFQQGQMDLRLESDRLGVDAQRLGLDTARVNAENQRLLSAEQLAQLQQRGTSDLQQSKVAEQIALIELAQAREQLAAKLGRTGAAGHYSPRGGYTLPSGSIVL